MKITHAHQAVVRKNSEVCVVTEYPHIDNDLDFAIVKVSGRYPDTKQATNLKCKEIVFIHSGEGTVTINNIPHTLNPGDVVMIEAGELFFWQGNMTLYIACTPAFNIEQHVMTV